MRLLQSKARKTTPQTTTSNILSLTSQSNGCYGWSFFVFIFWFRSPKNRKAEKINFPALRVVQVTVFYSSRFTLVDLLLPHRWERQSAAGWWAAQ
jgi:hypothetical protein